jgi:hypothetical protein
MFSPRILPQVQRPARARGNPRATNTRNMGHWVRGRPSPARVSVPDKLPNRQPDRWPHVRDKHRWKYVQRSAQLSAEDHLGPVVWQRHRSPACRVRMPLVPLAHLHSPYNQCPADSRRALPGRRFVTTEQSSQYFSIDPAAGLQADLFIDFGVFREVLDFALQLTRASGRPLSVELAFEDADGNWTTTERFSQDCSQYDLICFLQHPVNCQFNRSASAREM